MAFEAKYRSECTNCSEYVEVGDWVQFEGNHVEHVECEPEPAQTATCGECFMQVSVSGACGC